MTGGEIRIKKFLPEGENVVVVAMDHGEFFGPTEGLHDLAKTARAVSGADAILLAPGAAEICAGVFARRGAPLMVMRLNWASSYAFQWDYNESHCAHVVSPEEALALGADLGLASCILKTGDEGVDTANIKNFAEIIKAKRHAGLPVIGEYYPVNRKSLDDGALTEQVSVACRVMAEIGADGVKTFYTGERFAEIVKTTPIPVMVLGADKMQNETDALRVAWNATQAGARGVFFGRNVTQSKDPAAFLEALKMVVKEGVTPEAAANRCGI